MSTPSGLFWRQVVLVSAALLLLWPRPGSAIELHWIMFLDPMLERPAVQTSFPDRLLPLWLKGLESEERDLRRRAAVAIVKAHALGLEGVEVVIEPLTAALREREQPRDVRLTAAFALVELDAQQSAGALFEQLDDEDLEMAEQLEPALCRWQHAPMRERLQARLSRPVSLPRWHVLAIRGLSDLAEASVVPHLISLANDSTIHASIRLEAAAALGNLQDSKLLEGAKTLSKNKTPRAILDRLVAARMLKRHRGPGVEQLLIELALDTEPAVQTIALGHLYAIDPDLILPFVEQTIASRDVSVRRWGARTLIARPSNEHLELLTPMLDDRDPGLRIEVCDALLEFARQDWHETVVVAAREVLFQDSWRGQEQATLLLVTLDDKTIANRLVELLEVERGEAHATAAWGLSVLQVPETAGPILTALTAKTDKILRVGPYGDQIQLQLSHLAQALGALNYVEANETLRKFIQKGTFLQPSPRSAAFWALGHLEGNSEDRELIELLRLRMVDVNSMEPEDPVVRTMAAVTLGRLKAADTLPSLRRMLRYDKINSSTGYSCAWAIRELTGETIPDVPPLVFQHSGWFLMPLNE